MWGNTIFNYVVVIDLLGYSARKGKETIRFVVDLMGGLVASSKVSEELLTPDGKSNRNSWRSLRAAKEGYSEGLNHRPAPYKSRSFPSWRYVLEILILFVLEIR